MSFLVVANWKMNGSSGLLSSYLKRLNSLIESGNKFDCRIVVCPPFTCLSSLSSLNPKISIGGQDCFYENNGPYTGEISASMLYDCGCRYVIIGHSERKKYCKETNLNIKLKAESAIKSGLVPIICVGETMVDRESEMLKNVLVDQCLSCLPDFGNFFLAYEPVWAIGKASLPKIDYIQEALDILCSYSDKVIYGGSVSKININDVMKISNLSGILVGAASIDINSFCDIVSSVEKIQVS